jgi:hypothetical protein
VSPVNQEATSAALDDLMSTNGLAAADVKGCIDPQVVCTGSACRRDDLADAAAPLWRRHQPVRDLSALGGTLVPRRRAGAAVSRRHGWVSCGSADGETPRRRLVVPVLHVFTRPR